MQERLRGEDLPDRRGERRPADLLADACELVEHLVEPVAGSRCARSCASSAATRPARQAVLRGADGDARRERRDRLVADVLVDEVGGAPERFDVDARVEAEARERRQRAPRRRRGAAVSATG